MSSYKAWNLLRMLLGSGGGRFVCLWRCCLLSVPLGEQASGRRWDCSGLGHVARRCFGTKCMVRWCAGGTEYPRWPHRKWGQHRDDIGNEDNSSFARFFKLDKYAMFSFAMTSGLASDYDKYKITITLRRAQKIWGTGPYKNFIFQIKLLILGCRIFDLEDFAIFIYLCYEYQWYP